MRGVYLVFDGKAILGTRARKIRSKSYSAFESINYPVAAFIDENRIIQYVDGESRDGTVRFYENLKPSVFVLKLIPGMDRRFSSTSESGTMLLSSKATAWEAFLSIIRGISSAVWRI